MTSNDRIKLLIDYLKQYRFVRNQQEFSEIVKSDKSTISQILNNKIDVPNGLYKKIGQEFPFISMSWLINGEGEMLKENISQTSHGDNSPNINGHSNHLVSTSNLLGKALDEISEMRKALTDALEVNQKHTDKLLTIIEKMTK